MDSPLKLMKKYGITPNRRRGQNFLIDKNILKKIVDVAELSPDDTVVEIGPGLGVLTAELADRAGRVIAVELDKTLAEILVTEFLAQTNVEIIQDDALDVPTSRYAKRGGEYSVVANIPYNITSRIIRKFLEEEPRPSRLILLVQKEVAERIMADDGNHSLLSLAVAYFAEIEFLFPVSRTCFVPPPKVQSAVIRLTVKPTVPPPEEAAHFFAVLHAAFAAKRKYVISNIVHGLEISRDDVTAVFRERGLDEKIRAQAIGVTDWIWIAKKLNNFFK